MEDVQSSINGGRKRRKSKRTLYIALALVAVALLAFVLSYILSFRVFYIPSAAMTPTLHPHDRVICSKADYWFSSPKRGDVVVVKAPERADVANPQDPQERMWVKRVIAVGGDEVRIIPGRVVIANAEYTHRELRDLLSAGGFEGRVNLVSAHRVLVDDKPVAPKEIAAAAGEPDAEVFIMPGRVYVNGEPIKEDYVAEDPDERYPNNFTPKEWVASGTRGQCRGKPVVKIPQGCLFVLGDNRNNSRDSRHWGLLEQKRVIGKVTRIVWPSRRSRAVR